MNHYVCIHGHFHQPPRENPWLEEVELQDSANPYHDWNERVNQECYAPNTAARILGPDQMIINIVNNYKKISHDFSPTLLSWMETKAPETLKAIVEASKDSISRFSNHTPAMAQAFNHMILPLANLRDRRTQVIWGIKKFEKCLGEKPEGMWLPETAVDNISLEIIAEQGIKFVILAPHQIARFRKIGGNGWIDASNGLNINTPYICNLNSGRTINIFVYNDLIAKDVAFANILENGESFAVRLIKAFSGEEPQIVHIATDGETYGHHHSGGDMALAYCLNHIESKNLARITVYGEYLEKYPPNYEAEIAENTSWSCPHGLERWKDDCGCNSGKYPDWNQSWRKPLRQAMDWLRDALLHIYESEAALYFHDPWKTRDEYIEVILNRSPENVERFLSQYCSKELSHEDKVKALKLLEMQRHAMLMYVSDGWFFDEISGTETVQILKYAARAIQLAGAMNSADLEQSYLKRLSAAKSNIPTFKDGKTVYEMFVNPSVLNLQRVAVHYAMSSLFSEYPEKVSLFSYIVDKELYDFEKAGDQKLAVGKIRINSKVTWEEDFFSFAILHFGGHNLIGGARKFGGDEAYNVMQNEIKESFSKRDIAGIIRLMDKHFGAHNYSLWHLFKDEQRRILQLILRPGQEEIDAFFHQAYERHYPEMQVMIDLGVPLSRDLQVIVDYVTEMDLRRLLDNEKIDLKKLTRLAQDIKKFSPRIDRPSLNIIASQTIDGLMEKLNRSPEDLTLMYTIVGLLNTINDLNLEPNLWKAQNILFTLGKKRRDDMKAKANQGDQHAVEWKSLMKRIENLMHVKAS